jgi:hypothetical protein
MTLKQQSDLVLAVLQGVVDSAIDGRLSPEEIIEDMQKALDALREDMVERMRYGRAW